MYARSTRHPHAPDPPPKSPSYTDTFTITCIRVTAHTGVAMQDEAVELSSSSRSRVCSALHRLDLRGAAARLDAAAAPRGVLLDQDLREVIRVGRSSSRGGLGVCERIVSRGGEKAGSRRVEAAGSRGGVEIREEMGIGR